MRIVKEWKHKTTACENKCFLFGVNVFKLEWIDTNESVLVYDPLYNQPREADVYKVKVFGFVKKFAAVELSYAMWGFYVQRYTLKLN